MILITGQFWVHFFSCPLLGIKVLMISVWPGSVVFVMNVLHARILTLKVRTKRGVWQCLIFSFLPQWLDLWKPGFWVQWDVFFGIETPHSSVIARTDIVNEFFGEIFALSVSVAVSLWYSIKHNTPVLQEDMDPFMSCDVGELSTFASCSETPDCYNEKKETKMQRVNRFDISVQLWVVRAIRPRSLLPCFDFRHFRHTTWVRNPFPVLGRSFHVGVGQFQSRVWLPKLLTTRIWRSSIWSGWVSGSEAFLRLCHQFVRSHRTPLPFAPRCVSAEPVPQTLLLVTMSSLDQYFHNSIRNCEYFVGHVQRNTNGT